MGFGRFWWDFIVGDDWRCAAGVVLALVVADVAVRHGANPWWLLPVAVPLVLAYSLARAARPARRSPPGPS